MASFGHISVQIAIRQPLNPDTPSEGYGRFASRWLYLDTFLSRSRLSHFRTQIHLPKTMASFGYLSVQICIKQCSCPDKATGNIPECSRRSKNQECSKWSLRRRERLWRERFGTTFFDIPALKANNRQPKDRLAHFDSY